MWRDRAVSTWLTALTALAVATAQSEVYTLGQYDQLITSSALQWVSLSSHWNGSVLSLPADSVLGSAGSRVCRAAMAGGGAFHAGRTTPGEALACQMAVGDAVLVYRAFQTLVNVDGAARLEWADWAQFRRLPVGAVSVDKDVFVARCSVAGVANGSAATAMSVGGLYTQEQYGLIVVAEQEDHLRRQPRGQVLIEREPTHFEMKDFGVGRVRAEQRKEVALKQHSHVDVRASDRDAFPPLLNVSFGRTLYFGRGQSIPSGKAVTLTMANKTRLEVVWGLESTVGEWRNLRLAHYDLDRVGLSRPGQLLRVPVVITATEVTQRVDFSATLLSHYDDGVIFTRPVSGVFQLTFLDHFRPTFGLPMWVQDDTDQELHFRRNNPTNYNRDVGSSTWAFPLPATAAPPPSRHPSMVRSASSPGLGSGLGSGLAGGREADREAHVHDARDAAGLNGGAASAPPHLRQAFALSLSYWTYSSIHPCQ